MKFYQLISMAELLRYSIAFYDPDGLHYRSSGHITFCEDRVRLNDTIHWYGQNQVQITVCICCANKRDILNELHLRGHPNIALIMLCTAHHQNQYQVINYPIRIQENPLTNDEHWQLSAHASALSVNERRDIFLFIYDIIRKYLEQNSFSIHGSQPESNP